MKKYLTDANSALGYVALTEENLVGIDKTYYFKNCQGQLADKLMRLLSDGFTKYEENMELIYSAFDMTQLAGIVLRERGIAFVSGETQPTGAIEIDFAGAYEQTEKDEAALFQVEKELQSLYQTACFHLNQALSIHDDWEKIYISNMDFEKADALKEKVLTTYFNFAPKAEKGVVLKRFFGGATGDKYVDFVPELTEGLKRYLIKGRAGTGKSTLMKAVAKHTEDLGYTTEIYYCGFDPNSVDMVLIPEMNVCIFDATLPHEYFPDTTSADDVVIDTYEAFVTAGTDERYANEIQLVGAEYKAQITLATRALKGAENLRAVLSAFHDKHLVMDRAVAMLSYIK